MTLSDSFYDSSSVPGTPRADPVAAGTTTAVRTVRTGLSVRPRVVIRVQGTRGCRDRREPRRTFEMLSVRSRARAQMSACLPGSSPPLARSDSSNSCWTQNSQTRAALRSEF